jgi:hypothetical protein
MGTKSPFDESPSKTASTHGPLVQLTLELPPRPTAVVLPFPRGPSRPSESEALKRILDFVSGIPSSK